jgi:hypothetical protein
MIKALGPDDYQAAQHAFPELADALGAIIDEIAILERLNSSSLVPGRPERSRELSLAITDLESATHWLGKAVAGAWQEKTRVQALLDEGTAKYNAQQAALEFAARRAAGVPFAEQPEGIEQ